MGITRFGQFSNSARTEPQTRFYTEDLAEIVLGDELGYHEVWISEHTGSPLPGVMTVPELLIAKASGLTSRIRLGSAVRLLPLFHPTSISPCNSGSRRCSSKNSNKPRSTRTRN